MGWFKGWGWKSFPPTPRRSPVLQVKCKKLYFPLTPSHQFRGNQTKCEGRGKKGIADEKNSELKKEKKKNSGKGG